MAWTKNGTVAATNGQTAVTGTGTSFIANKVQPGDAILLADGRYYEIAGVVSDTALTLAVPYAGGTASGMGYAVLPTNNRVGELAGLAAELLNGFATVRDTVGLGMFSDGTVAAPGVRFTNDQDTGLFRYGGNALALVTGGVGRVFVNSAGNVGLGVDPTERLTLPGNLDLLSGGDRFIRVGSSSNYSWSMTAIADDLEFRELNDPTKARLRIAYNSGTVRPGSDNVQSLGGGSHRWSVVYAGTGSINTSDEREKEAIGGIPDDWLDAWGDVEWCRFKFRDAVAAKGDDARWHVGMIAQQVRDAFAARDLDAIEIGLLCHDAWDAEPALPAVPEILDADGKVTQPAQPGRPASPAGDRWGLRYAECQAIEAAWQRRQIAVQSAEIAALRSMMEAAQA